METILYRSFLHIQFLFLCRLRSIATHRDHFVGRLSVHLSVCPCVCLSGSHTFLVVMHSYVSQAIHAFLGMLPLCLILYRCMFCDSISWVLDIHELYITVDFKLTSTCVLIPSITHLVIILHHKFFHI